MLSNGYSSYGNYGSSFNSSSGSYVSSGLSRPRYSTFSNRYETTTYPTPVNYKLAARPPVASRAVTVGPEARMASNRAARQRTVFRSDASPRLSGWREPSPSPQSRWSSASPAAQGINRNLRLKSPSIPKETTRDELIDSIVHTRTREHRVMPGFRATTDFDERRHIRIDCDKVYNGIILANGETIQDISYLQSIGVTHVLNTAERHVPVNPAKFGCYGIHYYGFHVDDLPEANISRHFHRTSEFIASAINGGGLVVVNCVMGWSRSATCVAAYLIMKHNMSAQKALELMRQTRPIRPNAGFLQQLADLENTLTKRIW